MARRRALATAALAAVVTLLLPVTAAQAAPPSYVALGDSDKMRVGRDVNVTVLHRPAQPVPAGTPAWRRS